MSLKRSYKDQLETVSSAFSNHLQERLQEIESIWKRFKIEKSYGNEILDDTSLCALKVLCDIAHELHGQGTLFGYPSVTRSAGILEIIVEQLINTSTCISEQIHNQISANIHELRDATLHDVGLRSSLFIDNEAIAAIFNYKNREVLHSQPRQILVIEDAHMMRRRIAISLRQAGFEVHEAADGISGIELAIKIIPDLILLDIKMPTVDGFEVQKTIRAHVDLADVPLIFLTSLSRVSIGQIKSALSYGVTDYIPKPFNMDKLIEKIKTNLT